MKMKNILEKNAFKKKKMFPRFFLIFFNDQLQEDLRKNKSIESGLNN